jgi:hypothetical protein
MAWVSAPFVVPDYKDRGCFLNNSISVSCNVSAIKVAFQVRSTLSRIFINQNVVQANSMILYWLQVFLLHPPLQVRERDAINGSILMTRSKTNHRLMDVVIKHAVGKGAEVASNFHIE